MRIIVKILMPVVIILSGITVQAQQATLSVDNQVLMSQEMEAFIYGPYATPLDLEMAYHLSNPNAVAGSETPLMLDCRGSAPCSWVKPGVAPALQTHSNARNQVQSPENFLDSQMGPERTPEQEARRRAGNYLFDRLFRRSN